MLKYYTRAARDPDSPTVIVLHGFGANAANISPVADLFDSELRYNWLFPEAPLALTGYNDPQVRAWFPDDHELQQAALAGHYFNTISAVDPPGLPEAAQQVVHLIEALSIDSQETILGGFSQGAMVALEIIATQLCAPRGALIFSGALTAFNRWQEGLKKSPPTPFLQSHGRYDQALSYQDGHALYQLLTKNRFEGRFISFEGGHEISPVLHNPVRTFLEG